MNSPFGTRIGPPEQRVEYKPGPSVKLPTGTVITFNNIAAHWVGPWIPGVGLVDADGQTVASSLSYEDAFALARAICAHAPQMFEIHSGVPWKSGAPQAPPHTTSAELRIHPNGRVERLR